MVQSAKAVKDSIMIRDAVFTRDEGGCVDMGKPLGRSVGESGVV